MLNAQKRILSGLHLLLFPCVLFLMGCSSEFEEDFRFWADGHALDIVTPEEPDTVALDSLDWSAVNMPPEPDYSDPDQWYIQMATLGGAQVDVFYICPTVIVTDYMQNWRVYGHMNVYDDNQRKEMSHAFDEASPAFGVATNFYTFYYRQISLQSFIDENTVSKRYPYAFQDVKRAFNYFIENYSNNRPFILAGFSQGGKGVVELVKALPSSLLKRMVAAYVIGYKVTEEDLAESPNIVPAQGPKDVGVTCCFSSVGDERSIWPIIQQPVACAINPISWSVDGEPVEIPWAVGEDKEKPVTVRKDMERNIMFVENYGTNDLGFYPATWVMGKQNYHTKEFSLYAPSIAQNVADRTASYFYISTGIHDIRW